MRYASASLTGSALVFGCCLAFTGCTRAPLDPSAAAPNAVTVSYPVEREITDYADFTARTAAVDSVEVRARVWGYLKKVSFKEGTLVKKGDVLFELDPRPYEAEYARCSANLNSAQAHLARTLADFKRAGELLPTKAMAQSDYDLAKGNCEEAAAAVKVAEATLKTAELNLDFTRITAPVSGRVSRYLVTVGNLIQSADQANVTLLTTIVSVDPMYAYFDADERTVLRVRQLIRKGKAKPAGEVAMPVTLGLANEDGFPHAGTIDFIDNQINPKTGTQRFRGTFPNKDDVLLPGLFAHVRMSVSAPHQALLVTDRAVDTDQGQKIVYVVNDKNEVVSRPIRMGLLHDGLREIEDGLKPGERVIVNGLQTVRPGITVQPQVVDMPKSNPKWENRPRQIQISASQ
ncbi:MAG: efflux RND transporter periplasmic adaptor subunit [Thermoguttaceae bacterium]